MPTNLITPGIYRTALTHALTTENLAAGVAIMASYLPAGEVKEGASHFLGRAASQCRR
jgi:hypothetical protein